MDDPRLIAIALGIIPTINIRIQPDTYQCVKCRKEIPPGKQGRQCKECR